MNRSHSIRLLNGRWGEEPEGWGRDFTSVWHGEFFAVLNARIKDLSGTEIQLKQNTSFSVEASGRSLLYSDEQSLLRVFWSQLAEQVPEESDSPVWRFR